MGIHYKDKLANAVKKVITVYLLYYSFSWPHRSCSILKMKPQGFDSSFCSRLQALEWDYQIQKNRHIHIKTGAELGPETLWIIFWHSERWITFKRNINIECNAASLEPFRVKSPFTVRVVHTESIITFRGQELKRNFNMGWWVRCKSELLNV